MKYYVVAIEQIYDKDEKLSEYAPQIKKYDDFQSAETYFLTRGGEIANSIGTGANKHTYGDLRILNSCGGEERRYTIGSYIDVEALAKAEAEKEESEKSDE